MNPKRVKLNFVPFFRQLYAIHGANQQQIDVAAIVAGARGGKTFVGKHIFVDWAIKQPDYPLRDQLNKVPYTMVAWAPTYKMLANVVQPNVIGAMPRELVIQYHRSDRRLELWGVNGKTVIHFITASDPEKSQGLMLHRGWIDEAALVQERMFDEAMTRLSDRNGTLLLTTTPRGPNWLKARVHDEALDNDRFYFTSWRTCDNPYFSPEVLAQRKRIMSPREYRRVYEASWEAFEGMVFEEWSEAIHKIPDGSVRVYLLRQNRWLGPEAAQEKIRIVRVIAGIDWGYVNETAIVVIGVTDKGEYLLLDEIRDTQIPFYGSGDTWVERAKKLDKTWNIQRFWADSESPDAIRQFRKAGLKVVGADKTVLEGISVLTHLMHPDPELGRPRLRVIYAPGFCDEVLTYEWDMNAQGIPLDRPKKQRDHSIDAVRYAIYNDVKGRFRRESDYRSKLPDNLKSHFLGAA